MNRLVFVLLLHMALPLVATAQSADLNTPELIAARCKPSQQIIYSNDFKWGYELPELLMKFVDMYQAPQRLDRNAYWNSTTQRIQFPYEDFRGGEVTVSETFVQTVARHIEEAFRLDVVDGVFFPDMGHSHFLIPDALWESTYDRYPVAQMSQFYRDLLKDPKLKILYHTAEQVKMLDDQDQVLPDSRIQHRHRTRNIVAPNSIQARLSFAQNPQSPVNTVSDVKGYFWWGSGFNLSANSQGCFAYRAKGKVFYFDMSLYDLPYTPTISFK